MDFLTFDNVLKKEFRDLLSLLSGFEKKEAL